jgi:hypothetical protein
MAVCVNCGEEIGAAQTVYSYEGYTDSKEKLYLCPDCRKALFPEALNKYIPRALKCDFCGRAGPGYRAVYASDGVTEIHLCPSCYREH